MTTYFSLLRASIFSQYRIVFNLELIWPCLKCSYKRPGSGTNTKERNNKTTKERIKMELKKNPHRLPESVDTAVSGAVVRMGIVKI